MTWAELIREYYKKCMESNCSVALDIEAEPGAHYIFATAHNHSDNARVRRIIGYVGLGAGGVDGRMHSYDAYKRPDDAVDAEINEMIETLWGNREKSVD